MKKVFLILALVFAMGFDMLAQHKDGFFSDYDNDPYNRIDNPNDIGLHVPNGTLGNPNSEPAPIGNGLIILTALGVAYTFRSRKKNSINKLVS